MKFVLVVWVCSFINNVCSPPINHNINYNTWGECVDAALNYSITFLQEQNVDEVNEFKMATKFICKEVGSV